MFDHCHALLNSFYLKNEITMIEMFLLPDDSADHLIYVFIHLWYQLIFHLTLFKVEDFSEHLMNLQQFCHFCYLFSMYFQMVSMIHDIFLCIVFVKVEGRDLFILK